MTQILHSAKGSIQDDKRSDSIQDDRAPFLCTTPLSFIDMCAGNHQYTLCMAFNVPCTHLTFSADMCAADPCFTP